MKLGSLQDSKRRDGIPVVISRDNKQAVKVDHIVGSIREAIEDWDQYQPKLKEVFNGLQAGKAEGAFAVNEEQFHSPLPRAFQWADGSAFIQHIKLVRQARNAPIPETLFTVPMMYQGGSDNFLAPRQDVPLVDPSHGMDFEGEVAVVTDAVPMGTRPEEAVKHILLVMLCNDVSLRGLIPGELAIGFGFFQSKPSSSFSPFALTPDELGDNWRDGKIQLPLVSELNGQPFGRPNGDEMHFSFGQLIAHAARTRDLGPGTVIGSGTISNEDPTRGGSCLQEKRMLEKIETGDFVTPFMQPGDSIKISMCDNQGQNLFGTIEQQIVSAGVADYVGE